VLTASGEVVASAIKAIIEADKVALGVVDVFYGDQATLPHTPAVCVSPGTKAREFAGATLTTANMFETYVYVYFGKVQDVQANLHSAQTLADAIEPLVQADITLGGIVISTLCTQNEPGLINKQGSLMMGNRLTFQSMSRTRLP
jgi:hypothetical protein